MPRKKSTKVSRSKTEAPPAETPRPVRLTPDEARTVLHRLLERHPELQAEADELARNLMPPPAIEEIADEVFCAVTDVDLDALNKRAGSHAGGYLGPGDAAWELLEESLEPLMDDLKRQMDAGLAAGAEALCVGIIAGLYRARNVNSDGALGWAPDFPSDRAGRVLREYFQSLPPAAKPAEGRPLLEILTAQAPEWADMFRRVAERSANG
jgi:hypothetical protein